MSGSSEPTEFTEAAAVMAVNAARRRGMTDEAIADTLCRVTRPDVDAELESHFLTVGLLVDAQRMKARMLELLRH